jgi:electron transport complex protein RnfA
MNHYLTLVIGAIFVNNIVLAKFLGLCPFFGVSKKTSSAISMGIAVTFVMTAACIVTWVVDRLILQRFGLEYLQTISFILVIASFVQLVELFMRKQLPALHKTLGIFLPLITTNCAILGTALINIQEKFNIVESVLFAIATGLGFTLALLLMSGIRERLALANIPKSMQGLPIAFITGGLMALVFLGFSGMIK